MRTRARLVSGTLLCALACIAPLLPPAVASDARGSGQPGGAQKRSDGAQVRPEWKLGMPVRSGNLTIYPVTSDEWSATERFITLDEGLRSGGVTVNELGGYRRVRGRGQSSQSDSAEVNTLSLTNRSGKTLILLAGELLVGGKQDRIVDHDRLVPSADTPMPLGVFCVDHGRGPAPTASFGHNQGATRSPGGARTFVGGAGGGGAGSGQMANPAVRQKAEVQKSQTEVWSK